MNRLILFLMLASALIGLGRFLVPGHDLTWSGAYQDFAHILVGVLLVFCFLRPSAWFLTCYPATVEVRRAAILCLLSITLLEIVMFAAR
jgi:hypothetical protein